MAQLLDKTAYLRLDYDGGDDIQVVHMTREEARAYFDSGKLPEAFDAALDLAQVEAEATDAIVVVVIRKSA
jgi:transcriptional regulator NrdR family protein